MRKRLLTTMSAAMLAAAGLAGTALADPPATDQPAQAGDQGFSPEDRAAFLDARVAALKSGLKLTAAQEKSWPALETALREVWKARADRAAEFRGKWKDIREHHNVVEGLRLRSQGLTSRGAELSKLADAAKPLFDSLDDAQKRRFGVLLFHVLLTPIGHGHWGAHADH
ncbi:Spy/CpxP family protein refolding chaperone [Methylocystis sp. MJC1]|uniref:Spy/CpxP family protein refolding chaperone n=1 Tax=Methylocystis sp. MJC1 TaxID=2654282 RepID=UPI001FED4CED|nr:Spy/CpxP family protein refolding chaperone [Methylocystis sp. MJC1]UZX12369.1 Spy/CpxP family protein refolding chaperone [Methylocystis sp. MJC1]